jgi:cytochrome c553
MKKTIACAALLAISTGVLAAGDIDKGKAAVEQHACFSCHGKDYNTPIDPSYPKLAGQHQDYIEHALIAYQRGTGGTNGRGNAIMGAQAKPLSKDDIHNIAAYLHSLPGSLVTQK